jgi:hypothetical protein
MVSASVRRSAAGALAAFALLSGGRAVAASVPPVPPSPADGMSLLKAKQWMVGAQSPDGGMPINGFAQRRRVNLWAALGLAAAGVNAQDQAKTPNSRTLFGLLRTFSVDHELTDTADLALYLLAAHAVGFTGIHGEQDAGAPDTVADLLAAQLPGTSPDRGAFRYQAGATTGDPLSTAYAALALSSIDRIDLSYAGAAAAWLAGAQHLDGSWGAAPGDPGDAETTATVLEALAWAPGANGPAISHGASWLGLHQGDDGGWSRDGAGGAAPSDVPATAAVARFAAAQGLNPYIYGNGLGRSPMGFLRSAQAADGTVGRAPGVPADEPAEATAVAMLSLGGVGLVFGPIAGGADNNGGLPGQRPPAGLPSGPLLPTESRTPRTSTPATSPLPTAVTPSPSIQAPAAPATAPSHDGVQRVKPSKPKHKPIDDNNGTVPDAGAGSGGNGTLATPGAPNRAGGGGGVSTGTFRAPAATSGTAVPLAGRSGGLRAGTGLASARKVQGTLLGRQASTDGARGSSSAAAGALGSQSGGRTRPWWAIGLALLIAAGVAVGIRLDRRRPEVAL